jgi:hypothetical protein
LVSKQRFVESLMLITTLVVPMAYSELYPYPGGGTRAVGWAFVFGAYDTLEHRFVFYDPTYLLSFGSIVFIATVAVWLIISTLLVRFMRILPEEESKMSKIWLYVLIALTSQMIFPGLLLQRVPANHYGFVLPIPTQSVIAIVALFMRGAPLIPQWIMITTFLTPFGVEAFRSAVFDSGLVWYFPFWQLVHGTGEAGDFIRIGTFGLWGFLPLPLEVLMTAVLVANGIILCAVFHRVMNNLEWYTIGWVSALLALLIQTTAPLLAFLLILGNSWMYMPIIPIPFPSMIAIIGLLMIRRKESY